jgi:hypothetical protein
MPGEGVAPPIVAGFSMWVLGVAGTWLTSTVSLRITVNVIGAATKSTRLGRRSQ